MLFLFCGYTYAYLFPLWIYVWSLPPPLALLSLSSNQKLLLKKWWKKPKAQKSRAVPSCLITSVIRAGKSDNKVCTLTARNAFKPLSSGFTLDMDQNDETLTPYITVMDFLKDSQVLIWSVCLVVYFWAMSLWGLITFFFLLLSAGAANKILVVNNLAYSATEEVLQELFEKATSIRIPQNNGRPKG